MIALVAAAFAQEVPAVAETTGPDRSGPPPVAEPTLLEHPEPARHELAPGVVAWHVRAPGVRKVVVDVVLRRGQIELLGRPTQPGRATGWLADVAAGDLGGAELSELTDLHDVDLASSGGQHEASVHLSVPLEGLDKGLELQELVVRQPSFPKKELKRWVTDQELFYTVNGPSSQGTVANSALAFAWFPADHPYGARPDLGELSAVKTGALGDLWGRWTTEAPVTAVVVGDVEWARVEAPLRDLLGGLGAAGEPGRALPVEPPKATRVIAVDMPGQEQVAVRVRTAAPSIRNEDWAAVVAANWILGGHFLSRLNRNLREEKGFTYGSRSGYRADETWGHVTVEVDVKAVNLAETVTEIRGELDRLATAAPQADELGAMRRSLAADWNRTFENADRAAGLYRTALYQGFTVAELRARQDAIARVGTADVERVAKSWLGADRPRVWVLVGDRKSIEPELAELGLQPEWIDPDGAILGSFPSTP